MPLPWTIFWCCVGLGGGLLVLGAAVLVLLGAFLTLLGALRRADRG